MKKEPQPSPQTPDEDDGELALAEKEVSKDLEDAIKDLINRLKNSEPLP